MSLHFFFVLVVVNGNPKESTIYKKISSKIVWYMYMQKVLSFEKGTVEIHLETKQFEDVDLKERQDKKKGRKWQWLSTQTVISTQIGQ